MVLLGEKIKTLREESRYTQKELAERLNMAKASISAYERDVRQPPIDVVISLARVFNVSTDYLLLGKENMLIEVTGLNEQQRNHIRELTNQYRLLNKYNEFIEDNNLTKDFQKTIKK